VDTPFPCPRDSHRARGALITPPGRQSVNAGEKVNKNELGAACFRVNSFDFKPSDAV